MDHKLLVLPLYYSTLSVVLFIIVSENSPYLYLKTGLNLFSLIKLAVRHYFFVIVNM
jgi:hypothetical protein